MYVCVCVYERERERVGAAPYSLPSVHMTSVQLPFYSSHIWKLIQSKSCHNFLSLLVLCCSRTRKHNMQNAELDRDVNADMQGPQIDSHVSYSSRQNTSVITPPPPSSQAMVR